jgi:uncharacterized RDD family membrane protein YckC
MKNKTKIKTSPKPANIFKRIAAYIIDCLLGNYIHILYFSFLESSKWQASLAKKYLGLYVGTKDNKKLSFLHAFIRTLTNCTMGLLIPVTLLITFFLTAETVDQKFLASLSKIQVGTFALIVALLSFWQYIPVFFTKERTTVCDMLTGTRVYAREKAKAMNDKDEIDISLTESKTMKSRRKRHNEFLIAQL